MAFTTWSTTDLVNVTLSGGNLIATASANNGGVRGKDPKRGGKFYIEYTLPAGQNASNTFGFASRRTTLGAAATQAVVTAQYSNGTLIFYDIFGTQIATGVNVGNLTGSVLCCAIDLDARLVWFRVGAAGNWNASASNNPATGVGGVSTAQPGLGQGIDVYPFAFLANNTNSVTANFGASAFTGAVPSGFTSGWDDSVTAVSPAVATQTGLEHWATTNPQAWVTQTALEHWALPNAQIQLTQAAIEEWALNPAPQLQLTQAAVEQWATISSATLQMILTQAAVEQWATVRLAPGAGPMITVVI